MIVSPICSGKTTVNFVVLLATVALWSCESDVVAFEIENGAASESVMEYSSISLQGSPVSLNQPNR